LIGPAFAGRSRTDDIMRKAAILAGVLALSACAYPNPQHVNELNALVGKSETDLVRTQGVPTRTYETGGHKFLAYSRSRIESLPGEPGFGPYGWGGWGGWGGYGGWGGFPPEIIQRDCETTFEIANGTVLHWSFRGNAC
jgi:hypothetical protein